MDPGKLARKLQSSVSFHPKIVGDRRKLMNWYCSISCPLTENPSNTVFPSSHR
jgi:hypothetical protein